MRADLKTDIIGKLYKIIDDLHRFDSFEECQAIYLNHIEWEYLLLQLNNRQWYIEPPKPINIAVHQPIRVEGRWPYQERMPIQHYTTYELEFMGVKIRREYI